VQQQLETVPDPIELGRYDKTKVLSIESEEPGNFSFKINDALESDAEMPRVADAVQGTGNDRVGVIAANEDLVSTKGTAPGMLLEEIGDTSPDRTKREDCETLLLEWLCSLTSLSLEVLSIQKTRNAGVTMLHII
jgi:hypothetical protein